MKKTVLASVLIFLCILTIAQVPEYFNYQVVIRDGVSNDPLTNQAVSFRMSILKGSPAGASQYSELHSANTGDLGIVNLVIGNGTGKTGNLTTINWGSDTYFLKVEIDKTGGSSYVEMGTTQLLSVPYALQSKVSETADDAVKLMGDQIIGGTKTFSSTIVANNGINANNKAISNMADPTNAQSAATKAYVDALLTRIEVLEILNTGFIDSRDGNHYDAVRIGNQIWMADNLAYLPMVHNNAEFEIQGNNSQPGYGVYGYDGSDLSTAKLQANLHYGIYGVLYNWWATMNGAGSSSSNPSSVQGVCPTGWHLPSHAEWTQLEATFIEKGDVIWAGGKLKEILFSHWASPNEGATNETGFTAFAGGNRNSNGTFSSLGYVGYFWTTTENDATTAWSFFLHANNSIIDRIYYNKKNGYSVRCIKDN